jgi:hypothetical protein
VDEVDPEPVELGAEVVEAVELALGGARVEAVGPVVEQHAQVAQLRALLPADSGQLVRPAGGADPAQQVVEDLLGDRDRESLDLRRAAHSVLPLLQVLSVDVREPPCCQHRRHLDDQFSLHMSASLA